MLICLLVAQNNIPPSVVIAVGSKPMSPLLIVLQDIDQNFQANHCVKAAGPPSLTHAASHSSVSMHRHHFSVGKRGDTDSLKRVPRGVDVSQHI